MKCKAPNRHSCKGFSAIELLVVIAILAVFALLSVPTFLSAQRNSRANGIIREVASQLRLARQEAMSNLRAVTFQYDNLSKQMIVIRHTGTGTGVLTAGNYPNNGVTVRSVALSGGGVSASQLSYGVPSGVPTPVLGDNTTMAPLPINGKINITFQPDGSVINAVGNPVDTAIFIYNLQAPRDTATAISVLGSAGRVKMWRLGSGTNYYVE